MLPQRISFQPSVGRSIPSDLLRAMPGHWQLRELAGAYVNGNGRCLNVSSECRRPERLRPFVVPRWGDRATMSITTRKRKCIYALGGEGFISVIQQVIQQNDPDQYTLSANIPSAVGVRTGIFVGTSLYVGVPASGLDPAAIWAFGGPR